mgnify:CR=1 FL=1
MTFSIRKLNCFVLLCRWFISSVAEDNIVQIWQMALNLFDDETDEAAAESATATGT